MPRGLASSAKKRSSVFAILGKLTLLLLAAAAFLGWKFRGPIGDLALKYGQDWVQIAGLPAPEEAESSPVPGVDAIPSVTAKSSSSEKANKAVATADPQPLTAKPEVNASMHLPSISATPDAASPTVPATTEEVQKPATLASKGPEPEVRAVAAPAPKSDPPRAEPVQTAMNSTSTSTMPELVEVGRAKDDPKLIPESLTTTPHTSEVGRPIVKNVPPECLQALSALRGFLDATSWRERLKYIQLPGEMEAKAKEYYAKNPDGPVEVDEIEYYHHNTAPQVGKGMHVVFVLRSRAWQFPMGVPAMVEVHENEARVDWLTFVEFKDDLLNRFLKTYMEGPIRFHVGMRRTHYFEDDVPDIAGKHAFEIAPPMGNCHGYVFVPKDTPLARSLANTISWDKDLSLGVVELQWRREGGQKWIEMTALPQLNWYSQGASETSAASSAIAKPDAR